MVIRRIRSPRAPLSATVRATPSKSVTHRALVAAALARGETVLRDPLDADDTRVTREGLATLGVGLRDAPGAWIVEGCAGDVRGGGVLDLRESGTSMRLLAAVAGLGREPSVLDGAPRLRQRPMSELSAALASMGAALESAPTGGLPLRVGGGRPLGGPVTLLADRSSQFASALLLVGARLPRGIDVTLEGRPVSLPYVELTASVLCEFGVAVDRLGPHRWRVAPADYSGRQYGVEGDHSSASYFLAAAAITGGRIRVENLRPSSPQADAMFGEILERAGCHVVRGADHVEVEGNGRMAGFDVDLGPAPDLTPTVAVLALFAQGPSTVRGIAHLRYKESDRLELLARNLRSLGRPASAVGDRLEVEPLQGPLRAARISTGSDHRMAMAFAVAGLRLDGLTVDDADCVSKSNPRFWEQFAALEG